MPAATLRGYFNPQVLMRWLGTIAGTLGDFLTTMFIVVIVAIFILLEGSALPGKVRGLPVLSQDTWNRLEQIAADVRRYMFLKTVMSLLTGALVALWLLVLEVDFPILLGVLAFALNYIPAIGSIVAALPGILLAFVEFGLGTAVLVAGGYVVINVGVSNGIEPRYLGDGLGLSPLVVILSVLLWGWVLGPMGMLLSVPLTMSVKIALESDEGTRWLALLMSGRRRHVLLRGAAHQLRGQGPAAQPMSTHGGGMIVLRRANLLAPEPLGVKDVVIAGERIVALAAPGVEIAGIAVEEHDLGGLTVTPGLIDNHVHVLGGGGGLGFASRAPELQTSQLVRAGITAVIGMLGFDATPRTCGRWSPRPRRSRRTASRPMRSPARRSSIRCRR